MQYSSDEQLVALVKKGDHQAFSCLVKRHTNSLFRLAVRTVGNHADAEDIVQSVLLKFWQEPHKWHVDKSRLGTWLYTVVLNACRDWQRKQSSSSKRLLAVFDREAANESMQNPSEEKLLEQAQQNNSQQDALTSAIKELPVNQRDAINLVVFCELTQSQTAQILGVSVKAVESLLVRAKRNLIKKVSSQTDKSIRATATSKASSPASQLQPKERVHDV